MSAALIAVDHIVPRAIYEGDGGWKDGRLGQAYDLLFAVLMERGEKLNHPLLRQIEAMDEEEVECVHAWEKSADGAFGGRLQKCAKCGEVQS